MMIRIEEITKGKLESASRDELCALRLRSIQVFEKYYRNQPEMSREAFLKSYGVLVLEFRRRGIPVPPKSIDQQLIIQAAGVVTTEGGPEAVEKTAFTKQIVFVGKSEEERIVYGIVYEPDVTDAQGDYATAEDIRLAAYDFMEKGHQIKVNHQGMSVDVTVLESYIAPQALSIEGAKIKKGTWMINTRVNDDTIWEGIKKGEITGYSMAGTAKVN